MVAVVYVVIKLALTAGIVVLVSEVARRSTLLGGFLAALPLVSLLAMIWLYVDTGDTVQVAGLSRTIFWLVLPSLPLFLVLPWLLEARMRFTPALLLSLAVTAACYGIVVVILKRVGGG